MAEKIYDNICDFDGCLVKNGSSIFKGGQKISPLEKI